MWLTLQRTNEPVCPFGSFFSIPCQAAQGSQKTALSPVPSRCSLPLRGCANPQTNDVDD